MGIGDTVPAAGLARTPSGGGGTPLSPWMPQAVPSTVATAGVLPSPAFPLAPRSGMPRLPPPKSAQGAPVGGWSWQDSTPVSAPSASAVRPSSPAQARAEAQPSGITDGRGAAPAVSSAAPAVAAPAMTLSAATPAAEVAESAPSSPPDDGTEKKLEKE